jgi:hypothetical protein
MAIAFSDFALYPLFTSSAAPLAISAPLRASTGLQRRADGAISWFRNDIQHPGA